MTAEPVQPLSDVFKAHGMGWRAILCDRTVQLTVRRIRHDGGALRGYVEVEYKPAGGRRIKLAGELLNLSSGRDRASLANRLAERQQGPEWRNVLDAFCLQVESKESEGPELVKIGNLPAPIDGGWLVDNLIQRRQTTGIYGDGSVGKSFFALAVAVSLVTGLEVLPGFRPASRCEVTYCDFETDRDIMNRRVQLIANGIGIAPPEINYYRMEDPFADSVEWLVRHVQEERVGLVIVDSVEMAMMGSTGSGSPSNEGPARLSRAIRHLGISALVIDHINNEQAQQKEIVRTAYGSRFKRHLQRMAFYLKQAREPGPDKVKHLGLFNTKFNNGEENLSYGLAWEINGEWCRWWPERIEDEELTAALPAVDRIAAYLRREGPSQPSVIAEDTGIPRGTVSSALKRHYQRFQRNEHDLWTLVPEQEDELP